MKQNIYLVPLFFNQITFHPNYKYLFIYLLLINIITFIVFAVDKTKAINGRWRIRESVLLGMSFIGGAIGGLLAMHICHHKTKKARFSIGLPIMLFIQIAMILYLTIFLV